MALYLQLKFPSLCKRMEGGGSHMNVSYNCLIFHTGYTEDLKRFTNLMSIGQYFRLSHSTLQRFKIHCLPLCQNTCSLCGGGPIVPACEDEKEIFIWPCWCFHGRYYFYTLKFTLMFIYERKRNANTYLISNFDSLEAAPSNLPPLAAA